MNNKPIQLHDLGHEFQLDLFSEIIVDSKFGESVIEHLEVNHFKIEALQKIMFLLKNYFKKHEAVMTFPILRTQVNMDIPDITFRTQILDTISEIETRNVTNKNIKEYVTKFCKMSSLRNVLSEIGKKVEAGLVDEYDQIEKKLKDALIFRDTQDSITVYQDMENVLSDDYRDPIRCGIDGIDELIGGGLASGELALVIAPLGVGKTTFLTKVANQAYLDGRNVLQIFFEDKPKAIQRKHYSLFADIPSSKIAEKEYKELVVSRIDRIKSAKGNSLFLNKLPADGVTITKVKNIIKKLNSQGHKIDILILDYIDCISLEREYNSNNAEEWSNEGKVMRLLETMIEELNVACWTATQGNRASTSVEVVKTENMGGSLKKAQIAHFIMSIGKTLEQKENNVATISILKNRLGKDGMVFPNCLFNNDSLKIDTNDQLTEIGFEVDKEKKLQDRQRKLYQEFLKKREETSEEN